MFMMTAVLLASSTFVARAQEAVLAGTPPTALRCGFGISTSNPADELWSAIVEGNSPSYAVTLFDNKNNQAFLANFTCKQDVSYPYMADCDSTTTDYQAWISPYKYDDGSTVINIKIHQYSRSSWENISCN